MPVSLRKTTAKKLRKMLETRTIENSSSRDLGFGRDADPIIFRNDSGETVPAFACMKVTGHEEEDGRYVVVIDKPDSSGGPFLFNGREEVANGDRGSAQKGPVVRAKYTSGTLAVGKTWGPLSDWVIVANGNPAIVVTEELDTNVAGGIVINLQVKKAGKTDSSVAAASTVTVSIWRGGSDTTENITGVKHDWLDTGTISSGKEVFIEWFADEGVWRITGAECE